MSKVPHIKVSTALLRRGESRTVDPNFNAHISDTAKTRMRAATPVFAPPPYLPKPHQYLPKAMLRNLAQPIMTPIVPTRSVTPANAGSFLDQQGGSLHGYTDSSQIVV